MNQTNSIWKDENDFYYKLSDSHNISVGETVIRNCLNGEIKKVNKLKLSEYEISSSEAERYLTKLIEESATSLFGYLQKTLNSKENINLKGVRPKELNFNSKQIDWLKIICECLDITPFQIKNNPELLEVKIHSLLVNLANYLSPEASTEPSDKAEARKTLIKIQEVLSSNQLDLGNLLTDLFSFIREEQDNKNGDFSRNKHLKLPSELNTLIDDIRANSQLKDIIDSIVEREQRIENREKTTTPEVEYQESTRAIFQDIIDEHPLPVFDFDSLLEDN